MTWTPAGQAENHETTEALWTILEPHTPNERVAALMGLLFRLIDPTEQKEFDWLIRSLYTLRATANAAETRGVN